MPAGPSGRRARRASQRRGRGFAVATRVLGGRWERIREGLEALDADLARYVEEFAYGEVYGRPGLGLREREIIAITCLTLQGLAPQLKTHVYGALEVGLSPREVREAFIHIALYAGFPTALSGLAVAKEVLEGRPRRSRGR